MEEDIYKFIDSIPITYARYFKSMAASPVCIIRTLEDAFGKDNVHVVIKE